jgi:hypothetical protein
MHVLIGNLDVASIYYISTLADTIDTIQWNETDDIRVFFAKIYPFIDVRICRVIVHANVLSIDDKS